MTLQWDPSHLDQPSILPPSFLLVVIIWEFPDMGVPPNHPFLYRIVHHNPSSYWMGFFHWWNPVWLNHANSPVFLDKSIDWFKGRFTGQPHDLLGRIYGFPVDITRFHHFSPFFSVKSPLLHGRFAWRQVAIPASRRKDARSSILRWIWLAYKSMAGGWATEKNMSLGLFFPMNIYI